MFGAGAIGGVVGGQLFGAGHPVTLVARGAHLAKLRSQGLRLESPAGVEVMPVPAVGHPAEVDWSDEHVVLLTAKSQQTQAALVALAIEAPATTPIVCLQNGIANEPAALRLFPHVYGGSVACPTSYLEPGVVRAWASPVTGLLDVGRYPHGSDETSEAIVAAFASATFDARSVTDIRRWKHRKLLTNLGNAIEAVCGPAARRGELGELLLREGEAVLEAAGLDAATAAEDRDRRSDLLHVATISDAARPGGSTWQSLHRNTGDVETDYLNGEVVMLGRMHSVPTPANTLMQHLSLECASGRRSPCSVPEADILRELDQQSQ